MLNKQNVIISGLASIMLTCSFNYIAIAGLGNIDMKKINKNSNISINKPTHLVDSAYKGIAVRNHVTILKNIDALKGHLNNIISSKSFTPSELKDNPQLAKKLQIIRELNAALKIKENDLDILNTFNTYKARLARLYKDHNHRLVKVNDQIEKQNQDHQAEVEAHKLEQTRKLKELDDEIAGLDGKFTTIDQKIKAKELTLDADVSNYFNVKVQPQLVKTINFDRLTIGSLASTISFR